MNNPTADIPRCPYCVQDDNFTPMRLLVSGLYICDQCRHVASRDEEDGFRCICHCCRELHRLETVASSRWV